MLPTVQTSVPTSEEQRMRLLAAGFLRVDGLRASRDGTDAALGYIIEARRAMDLGRWDGNNGTICLTLLNGQVWIARYDQKIEPVFQELQREFAPNGQGCFVPLSNGEDVTGWDLISKASDPDYKSH